jgi:adenine phosphoribosyltransferase
VRDIQDYPTDGVTFRDITPLLGDATTFASAVDGLVEGLLGRRGRSGRRRRGAWLHLRLGGRLPHRRRSRARAQAGKLPWAVVREEYDLEYGSDKLEIHRDAIHPGERILIIDDVLATGGTAAATARLVETLGGVIAGLGFVLELDALGGRAHLGERPVKALLHY